MAKLIIGCGYLGRRAAKLWIEQRDDVYAVTRSPLRAKELAAEGMRPIVADVTAADSLSDLPRVDTVLYAVGYDRNAEPSMREVYVSGLTNVLDSLSDTVEKLIYVSSTGVYGQSADELVNELSPCEPDREGGKICLAAEQALRKHALGQRAIILRLAGIYGPGRIPRRADVADGKPIASPPDGIMNLIHVDDAAQIAIDCAAKIDPPELFCVSDGHPVERGAYYEYLAELLDAPAPRFETPDSSSHVSQRALSSKRIDSSKLHDVLGKELEYPTYREGLAGIVRGIRF